MNCYIASGFFNPNQLKDLENIKNVLEKVGIDYYNPKDEIVCPVNASREEQEIVFKTNIDASIFQNHLLKNGIMSIGVNNFCAAHTMLDVNKLIRISKEGFKLLEKKPNEYIKIIKPVFKRR